MTPTNPIWTYTMLLVQDPVDKGYTAFFAEFPNIVVEGDTKEEAKEKLFEVASGVFEYKRKGSLKDELLNNPDYPVSIEQFNAELASA